MFQTGGGFSMSVRLGTGLLGMLVAFAGWVPVALAATTGNTVTYKWTDDQGIVHYGDSVPPQYAQKERSVLNARGVEMRKLQAQKSAEQLATEARAEGDTVKQKQHDAFLMNTY